MATVLRRKLFSPQDLAENATIISESVAKTPQKVKGVDRSSEAKFRRIIRGAKNTVKNTWKSGTKGKGMVIGAGVLASSGVGYATKKALDKRKKEA